MINKINFAGLFSLLFLACADAPPANAPAVNALQPASAPPPTEQTIRGMYRNDGQAATFWDCSSGQTFRVLAVSPELDSLYAQACQPAPVPNESVYAVLRGKLDTIQNNTAGNRTFTLTGIDTVAAKTMFTVCQPFDFWCVGTEPFWGLYISEMDGGFSLKLIGEERGRFFPWAAPKIGGHVWTYATADPATGEKLTVLVREENCSDGMSDRTYQYSVSLQLGQQRYRGCAIRYGEPVGERY